MGFSKFVFSLPFPNMQLKSFRKQLQITAYVLSKLMRFMAQETIFKKGLHSSVNIFKIHRKKSTEIYNMEEKEFNDVHQTHGRESIFDDFH